MKKFNIYYANGDIEQVEAESMKDAKLFAAAREKATKMAVLQIYEIK